MRLVHSIPALAVSLLLAASALAAPRTTPLDERDASGVSPAPAPEDARDDAVDALLESGRAHLDAGRLEQAQADFDLAAAMDGDSLRTRTWVLRGWIGAGRPNDALDATDALSRIHPGAPELDYLYGMAFAFKAQTAMAAGVTDHTVGMQFQDAVQYLERATTADPLLYRDAFLALSLAAWYAQPPELDVARRAGEEAVRLLPDRTTAWFQLGRVAFSQYVSLRGDPDRADEARAAWERTLSAFDEALTRVGIPSDPAGVQLVGDARVQRGNAFLWEERIEEAAVEFGEAMGWNPAAVDLRRVSGQLGDSFGGALQRALAIRAEHKPKDSPNSATLYWWLGYTRLEAGRQALEASRSGAASDRATGESAPELLAASEAAFEHCLELRPDFANSWYFLGHGRYAAGDYPGAVAAFSTYWENDPAGFVAYVSGEPDYNVPRLEYLTGIAFRDGNLESAAALAAACANGVQDDSTHWNNLGLFLRDRADLLQEGAELPDPKLIADLHERAYEAYARALALEPENPALLNDTAVMLDYYLDRDLSRALAMYERAAARAETLLADPELSEADAELYGVALRDARNNGKRLRARLALREHGGPEAEEVHVGGGAGSPHDARRR